MINAERPSVPDVAQLRNVVVLGASGAGKSALVAALVDGPLADGPTRSLLASSTVTDDVTVRLLDTPGDPDFCGWAAAGIHAADAALFVIAAASGITPATLMQWRHVAELGMPRAVVITHLDRPEADFDEAVALCERILGESVVPTHLPLYDGEPGLDGPPGGAIEVLSHTISELGAAGTTRRAADPEHVRLLKTHRDALIEAIATSSSDDTLLDRYMDGEPLDVAELVAALGEAVRADALHPLVPAVPTTGVGRGELLAVLAAFPSPVQGFPAAAYSADGSPATPLRADPAGPLAAQILARGEQGLSLVHVVSGTLRAGSGLTTAVAGVVHIGLPRDAPTASAGEILTVAGVHEVPVGATLSDEGAVNVAVWPLPVPAFPVGLGGRDQGIQPDPGPGPRLVADDPSLHWLPPDELWCVGPRHADWVLDRLGRPRSPGDPHPGPIRFPAAGAATGSQHVEVTAPRDLAGALARLLTEQGVQKTGSRMAGDDDDSTVVGARVENTSLRRWVAAVRDATDGTATFVVGEHVTYEPDPAVR
ncbi:MAG: small GTP-binding protein [Frankiales bacterium]|nr:small GTP-binding protein [Frankiales bacterium]